MKLSPLAFSLVGALILASAPVHAENIYKWVDPNGGVHFSSKKPFEGATPASLPEITRGDFQSAMKKGFTCDKHGGIACQSGADKDGSVICVDGFKDASARFTFQCSSPKLIVSDISELSPNGEFKVFVRNSRSVNAKAPKVEFHLPDDKVVALKGPTEIEAYGMGEFTYASQPDIKLTSKPKEAQLILNCANCG